ncbi:tyrosine-type recombinase/integrase [Terriglobus roseus]|nr:site-specific integrase [Terriglobus roseus]
MSANGKVKPDTVLVKGVEVVYPTGRYELRSYAGTRTVWTPVDGNATVALAEQKTAQKKAAAKAVAKNAGVAVVEDSSRKVLKTWADKWVNAALDRGSLEAAELYRRTADAFLLVCSKTYADDLTHDDVLAFQRSMRSQGYADRTIANRHSHIRTFFIYMDLDKRIAGANPRYENKLPEVYEPGELKKFFKSLTVPKDELLFDILLTTGLREQEASHLEWTDIHWSRGTLKVQSKPKWGYRIKDAEEREMPLSDDLLKRLKSMKDGNNLIFGLKGDVPDGHLLRKLKKLVRDARLNCGKCDSCEKHNECENWFLHKFRATYITTLLRNGLDLRTVMTLSGHSDLESVMRYLRPAEGVAVKNAVNSIKWR